MSTRSPRLRLGARFLLLLVASALLWAFVLGPRYERGLTAASIALLHVFEPQPMTASARVASPYAVVSHTEPFRSLPEQWLDLATIHDNVPLLVALFLATPGLASQRRFVALAAAFVALAATHLLHFVLSVQWFYALHNVGPYRVTDLDYLVRGFRRSLDDPAQTAKYLINPLYDFYTRIGRLCAPIVLWMPFAFRASHGAAGRPRSVAIAPLARPAPLLMDVGSEPSVDRTLPK